MPRIRRRSYRRQVALVTLVLVALVGVLAVVRLGRLHDRALSSPAALPTAAAPGSPLTVAYGPSPDQVYDLWRAPEPGRPAPLVLFVHGGGWTQGSKDSATGPYAAVHFPAEGYAYASIDYRLVPSVTVEEQAGDVVSALASLLGRAAELGIDPGRVVLMGHSAGAHLVALVGTDPSYLQRAGLSEASLRGVVAIDGAAYDVPAQVSAGGVMHDRYLAAFGTDPGRQRALSPVFHSVGPNAPAFLLPHVQRPDGIAQAEELAAALRAAGTPVELVSLPGTGLAGHAEINRRLGDPSYAETPLVDAWFAKVLA